MKRYLPFIIILIVLAGAVGITVALWRRNTDSNPSNTPNSTTESSVPTTSAPTASNADDLTKPNVKVNSPVVLEEYGDYQCPPCGQLYPELKKIEAEYGTQLRVVFRHFPLAKIHKNAIAAARAAEAARNQDKFLEMHDRLYLNQKAWAEADDPRPVFVSYAGDLKLNIEQFTQDMESSAVYLRISADQQRGAASGVSGTPTVFIDSNMVRYEATTPDGLRRAINYMLKQRAAS